MEGGLIKERCFLECSERLFDCEVVIEFTELVVPGRLLSNSFAGSPSKEECACISEAVMHGLEVISFILVHFKLDCR